MSLTGPARRSIETMYVKAFLKKLDLLHAIKNSTYIYYHVPEAFVQNRRVSKGRAMYLLSIWYSQLKKWKHEGRRLDVVFRNV